MFTTAHRRSRHSTDTEPEFHAVAKQATASEGLAQGSYVAARAPPHLLAVNVNCFNEGIYSNLSYTILLCIETV